MSYRMSRRADAETLGPTVRDRVRFIVYAGAIALNLAALAAQAIEPSTELPKPSVKKPLTPDPQLEQLQYFQGTWTCSAQGVTVPFYPSEESFKPAPFTWTVARALNNFWFLGHEKTDQSVTTHDTLGFNSLTKRFGRTILTSDGEFVNLLSNGWVKQTWIWEGSRIQVTGKSTIREMVEKQGDRAFVSTYFILDEKRRGWFPVGKKVCRKSS